VQNLTVVVPFWHGEPTLPRLLDSLPAGLPVIVVDDHSDVPLQMEREDVTVIRPERKGFFSGAVNAGLAACATDVLVLNQDVWFASDGWLARLLELRRRYAMIGDGVLRHPAWPKGYIHGTFMFLRRDAIERVGGLDMREYPLWGSTCEWQLRACRCGFEAHPSQEWRRWMAHEGRHEPGGRSGRVAGRRPRYGQAISDAMRRWPAQRAKFVRTPPLVSVVVPCYNYGRYLADAVHSLIGGETSLGYVEPPGQTLQSFEVIIVDDASTDGSWEQARALADPWKGVKAIRLKENRGTPGAINAGVRAARGEYVHILSADDMREPWGLQVLYDAIRGQKKGVAYGDVRIFGWGKRGRVLKLPGYDFDLVLHKNPMPAGILYPRAAWEEVGGYPESMIYGREDWAFNIALGAAGYCGQHVGMSGNLYRRERQNRSLRTGNVHRGETPPEGKFSWRQTFHEQLRRLYPRLYAGERPVGCCGGRNSSKAAARAARAAATPTPRAIALATEADMVWLEYIGGNAGNTRWWGPVTGTAYVFGGRKTIGQVHAADAPGLIDLRKNTKALFRPYAMAVRKPAEVQVPKAEAERANPPQADDLTAIRGVGAATAERLRDAGYATFLALAKATAEQVAERAGVPMHVARKAVAGARAYA